MRHALPLAWLLSAVTLLMLAPHAPIRGGGPIVMRTATAWG